jgi:uncharacterized protein (UPF0332 family)/predicted nucleotidyltransferase
MKLPAEDEAWLRHYQRALAERFPGLVKDIIVYGSKARGTATADSDLDLLVVIRDGDPRLKEAVARPAHDLSVGTNVDPSILVFTTSEWEAREKGRDPFWSTVARDGRIVPSWEKVATDGDGYRMRPEHVLAELDRAERSLRSARLLHAEELYEDAASRSYYAVMHAARAALLVHDTVPESHAAVRRLFGQVLVRPGLIEKEWADILKIEQDERFRADYQLDVWQAEASSKLVEQAGAFVERIREYLRKADIPGVLKETSK